MVDTLVLGTSAKAWEFESLHAQLLKKTPSGVFFSNFVLSVTRIPLGSSADLRTVYFIVRFGRKCFRHCERSVAI